jgi:hypothetical protein
MSKLHIPAYNVIMDMTDRVNYKVYNYCVIGIGIKPSKHMSASGAIARARIKRDWGYKDVIIVNKDGYKQIMNAGKLISDERIASVL